MSKRNHIKHFSILNLFILYTNILPIIFSFPFYNLQSIQLLNGNFLMIHQNGIDICDKGLTKIIKTEIIFTDDEQITLNKMKNIIIKQFTDGYIVSLINDNIYIFNESGHFLYNSTKINQDKTPNYYSLTIKDNYHFYIGLITNNFLNIYYYEYNLTSNEIIKIAESGDISKNEKNFFLQEIVYVFENKGFNCYIMEHQTKGDTLTCFFITSNKGKLYWNIEFLELDGKSIIEHKDLPSIKKQIELMVIGYFKIDINLDKNKALICCLSGIDNDFCFSYDISQTDFGDDCIYPGKEICTYKYFEFKVNYFQEKDEFVFSCVDNNENIKYVIYKFDNSNKLLNTSSLLQKSNECEKFNGYTFYYSSQIDKYYTISDYICEKTIDNTDEMYNEYKEEDNEIIIEEELKEKIFEEEKEEIIEELLNEEMEIEKLLEEELIKEEQREENYHEEEEQKEEKEKEYECTLEKCLKCDRYSESKNLCKTCNKNKRYYPLKNIILKSNNNYIDCFNNATKPSNYYFNSSSNYYEPCYETCSKCEQRGDNINNNCLECAFGLIFIPGLNNNNCIFKCPYYFYYTDYGQYKCTSLSICPEDYYLLIKEKGQCIEDCSKDTEYKYQYNGECYKQCPNNSDIDINNEYICIDNNINKCSLSKRDLKNINKKITEEEIDNLVKSYLKEFYYTDNHISLYNYSHNEIAIYKNFECTSDLSLDIPSIDIGECYQKLKEEYDINDNLIFTVIVQKIEGINYPIISSFYVYSPYNGNKLDIKNICEKEGIKVEENIEIKISDKNQFIHIQYLSQQNIDVFNLSSDFYTDICYYFDSPINKDIALKDRIKLFFPNITLCENGCNIKGINSTTMKAECECKINNLMHNNDLVSNVFYKSQIGQIKEILSESNIEILKCGSNIFKYKNIFSYLGSIIILSLMLLQIIFTIMYFLLSIKPLKKYFFDILNTYLNYITKKGNFPPKKKVKILITGKNENKIKNITNKYIGNKTENLNCSKVKINRKNDDKKNITISSNNVINSTTKEFKINSNSNKDIKVYSKLNILNKKNEKLESKIKMKDYLTEMNDKSSSSINEFNINIEDYLETDLNDVVFEEIKERDHRTFRQYFVEKLKSNLLILNIFINNEPLKPRSIKLMLFIINIYLYLFINALFINEEFISNVFHSENNNFFSFLSRCVDRIFYTTLVKVLVNYIIDFFFIDEKKIKTILKSKRNTIEDIKIKINKTFINVSRRIIYFIIFSFILSLSLLYYITCFNYRYYYITEEWIKSSIFIILLMEVLTIIIILLESSLRYLSLKINSEKIYKLSLLIS